MRSAGSLGALLRGVGFAEVSVVDGVHRGVHDPNLPMNVMLQFTAVKGITCIAMNYMAMHVIRHTRVSSAKEMF